MRSGLRRWTSQLHQSLELPGCCTLRTFCGRRLTGVRRGGPGCSSQLAPRGRASGAPGDDPLPPLSGHTGHVLPPLPEAYLSLLYLTSKPFSSLGRLLGFSITGKTPLLLTVAQVPLPAKKYHRKPKNNPVPIPSSRIKSSSLSPPLPLL